jgi:hypothetical protein
MDAISLSLVLDSAASEVLRKEYKLLDNNASAPGYILFEITEENKPPTGRYLSYLIYAPEDFKLPLIYAFELNESMDTEAVKLAVQEAQDRFTADVNHMRRMAQARVTPVQGNNQDPVLWTGGSLERFGQNPYGQNIWRVVWGPTRLYLVGGRWTDREEGKITRQVDEYRWIPRYGDADGWVLEKWLSAVEFAGSKEAWDMQNLDPETGLEQLGPYPVRGEYESAWKFPTYPTASAVELVIQMIQYGKQKYNQADIRAAHRQALEAREKERGENLEAMIRDAMPAFPLRGLSGSPYRSAPDPLRLTTKDLSKRMPNKDKDFRQV